MDKSLFQDIGARENIQIKGSAPLYGGDINKVFHCASDKGDLVVKLNDRGRYPELFLKEANGLKELRKANAFLIPEVIARGEIDGSAYLIMEYLLPKPPDDWSEFGVQLAQLHQHTSPQFGFYEWNYIGSLRQFNDPEESAAKFFIQQRLMPQFALAAEKNYTFRHREQLYKVAEQLIPREPPALIHGDLWGGNYLHTEGGFALIDPAVSYAPREMDLAMMQLFGGFPAEVFVAYENAFPTAPGLADRIPLYQLYYILVHVNLFGSSYVGRAESIINRYL